MLVRPSQLLASAHLDRPGGIPGDIGISSYALFTRAAVAFSNGSSYNSNFGNVRSGLQSIPYISRFLINGGGRDICNWHLYAEFCKNNHSLSGRAMTRNSGMVPKDEMWILIYLHRQLFVLGRDCFSCNLGLGGVMESVSGFYAHTPASGRDWHDLVCHLEQTATRARENAAKFGAGEVGYLAGLWHD